MARNVVKLDAARIDAVKVDDDKVTLTLRVARKTAWGVRMYALGRGKDLSKIVEPLLVELIRGKRIPWGWYEELTASMEGESRFAETSATAAEPAVEPADSGETLTSADPPKPAEAENRGGETRPSIAEVAARVRRRKAG
jgi:hypothetical protein